MVPGNHLGALLCPLFFNDFKAIPDFPGKLGQAQPIFHVGRRYREDALCVVSVEFAHNGELKECEPDMHLVVRRYVKPWTKDLNGVLFT